MSAPSFSSFPPSFSSFPDVEPPEPSGNTPKQDPSSSKHKHNDNEHEEKHRHRSERHGPSGKKSRRSKDGRSKQHSGVPRGIDDRLTKVRDDPFVRHPSKPLYYSDRRGDPLNIRYGTLHAGDIPKYRLIDRGRKVLGLSSDWTAFYRSRKGVEIGLNSQRKTARLTDSKSRALLALPPRRLIVNPAGTRKYEEIDGFIHLPSHKSRDNPESSYRAILPAKDNPHDTSSDSSDSESSDAKSSESDDGVPALTSLQLSVKSLEEELALNPTSVSSWLSLLSHTLSTIPTTSKNATKARSEITLSLLQRALEAHPENSRSPLLRVKYLKAGEEVWHESKVRAEWEDALKLGSPSLWMEWLEWRIRKGSKGIAGIMDNAQRAIRAIGSDQCAELTQVRVFWRLAVMLRNAGYTERAMAMFQAQSELTFEVPQDLYGLPIEQRLSALEEFWESEVPRAGEIGAKGWSSYFVSHNEQTPIKTLITAPAEQRHLNNSDPYALWSRLELESDNHSTFPARSFDVVADSDPYATILFTDIREVLLNLTSEQSKHAFRLAWLSFLGLHIPCFSASLASEDGLNSWDDRWSQVHLTTPTMLGSIFPPQSGQKRRLAEASAGILIGQVKEYAPVFGPIKSWSDGVLGPLDIGLVFPAQSLWSQADLHNVDVGFLRRLFQQLKMSAVDYEWDVLALAFESSINAKSAIKLSRSFLSNIQGSFLYWAAHAKLERLRGKLDEARKVYHTVLIASSPSPATKFTQGPMWKDWAEMEWLAGRHQDALQVILKSVGAEGNGGLTILRAKRSLEGFSESSAGRTAEWKVREAWIQLRALLELLCSGGALAALDIFDRYVEQQRNPSVADESLVVASLMLLYRYGTILKEPIAPALLRERASKALELFPSNSIIMAMFLESEKGQGVWGRVRSILGDEIVGGGQWKEKSVARRVEEVWIAGWEQGRWLSEVERTRKGLAGAVECERTRASHIIWRIYVEFEIRVGQLDRAKKLLYRAISECPLVKELYLLAFGPLRKVFTPRELNSFVEIMAEREIRMRSGLEEMLEGWDHHGDGSDSDSDSDAMMDEIEQGAQEYRRLLPY